MSRHSSVLSILIIFVTCFAMAPPAQAEAHTTVIWEKIRGGPNQDMGNELAIDLAGNIYFGVTTTGEFEGDPVSEPAFGMVVGKTKADGTALWTTQFATGIVAGIDVDDPGNVYIARADSLHKFATDGTPQWDVNLLDVESTARFYGLAVAGDGSGVYVCGVYGSLNDLRICLLKYDTTGTLLWRRNAGDHINTTLNRRARVGSDANGNVAIVACERETMEDNSRRRDMVAIRYNASGIKSWERRISGVSRAFDASFDKDGNVIGVGSDGLRAWSPTGSLLWSQPASSYGGLYNRADVVTGADGSIYMSTQSYVDDDLRTILMRLRADGLPVWTDLPPFGDLHDPSFPNLFVGDVAVAPDGTVVMIETVESAAKGPEVSLMKVQPQGLHFTSSPVIMVAAGGAYQYAPTANGPSPVTGFTVVEDLSWLQWNQQEQYLSGVAPQTAGTYGPITITATNGIDPDAEQTFSITVVASGGDVAPGLTSTAPLTATVGSTYSYSPEAVGNPAVTISATVLPYWLEWDGTQLTGVPPSSGTIGPITLSATNGVDPDAEQTFYITVSQDSNGVAPSFTSTAPLTATVGTSYSYSPQTAGDPAATVDATGLPGWLTWDGSQLSGTPQTAGTFGPITLTATNGVDPVAEQSFSITVTIQDGAVPRRIIRMRILPNYYWDVIKPVDALIGPVQNDLRTITIKPNQDAEIEAKEGFNG